METKKNDIDMERLEELLYRCDECFKLHGDKCFNETNCDIDKEISQNNIKTLIEANKSYKDYKKNHHWKSIGNFKMEKITPSSMKILSITPNKKIKITLIDNNKLQIELI